jgi:glc operon protein GlcG
MQQKWVLTGDDVQKVVEGCKREAAKRKLTPTIAIVDESGSLLYLERPHSHAPFAVEMASGKARTSALRGRPSSALEERAKERPGFLMMPNCLPIRGGVPLFFNDQCVGGVGISGLDANDEPIAQAGANALTS